MKRIHLVLSCLFTAFLMAAVANRAAAEDLRLVAGAQADRIKTINKVKPAVVAVYARGGGGGGSGVVIDKDGYALTNFHVVQPTGPTMVCGLPNGILYDAVLVGLDKVGDVALIKLIPKKPGDVFPFVELGNSDDVKAGDWSLAMGNPFLLATDFTPSVSYGLISGVNRYQYPSGGFLEYTDCIQFDTTINPGNSGGPLFNMNGELIGINGRGSFAQEKRFRINCGVGYAISINQIKNFLGHLRAGIDTDHATLGAAVASASEDGDLNRMIVSTVLEESDAFRRGLGEGDQLISFAGRPLTSVNQYKNILGIFPRDWRMPLVYTRKVNGKDEMRQTLVRLMGYQPAVDKKQPEPKQPGIQPIKLGPQGEGAKFYSAKKGFANYYFNAEAQKRLRAGFLKHGDFSSLTGDWSLEGTYEKEGRVGEMRIAITEEKIVNSKDTRTVVNANLNIPFKLEPLRANPEEKDLMVPPFSGGLLMAIYHYNRLLVLGPKGFEGGYAHGGVEPVYVQPLTGPEAKSFSDVRVMAEVLRTEHAGVAAKWYFYRADLNPLLRGKAPYQEYELIAFETFVAHDQDPCEVYLHESKPVEGRLLPTKMEIRHGDKRYCVLNVANWKLTAAPK
jgi:serine protease Do